MTSASDAPSNERAATRASEDCLREHEQRDDDAESSVRDEQHAYRPRATEETPVEESHQRVVPRCGATEAGSASTASGDGSVVAAPRRWRKT